LPEQNNDDVLKSPQPAL